MRATQLWSRPKYTRTLQTETSVSKNFLSSGGGFAHSSHAGAGTYKSPRLCSASEQEESSENLPGQLETSWVTVLHQSHLKINRLTIKDRNGLWGRSLKAAWPSGSMHTCVLRSHWCSLLHLSHHTKLRVLVEQGTLITLHEQRRDTSAHGTNLFSPSPTLLPLGWRWGPGDGTYHLGTRMCNGTHVATRDL